MEKDEPAVHFEEQESTPEVAEPAPVKRKVKKKRKKAANPKPNAWLAHVKGVRAKNADLSYKECLKLASKSWKKA